MLQLIGVPSSFGKDCTYTHTTSFAAKSATLRTSICQNNHNFLRFGLTVMVAAGSIYNGQEQ